jgi:hypothetical protein
MEEVFHALWQRFLKEKDRPGGRPYGNWAYTGFLKY